MSLEKFIKRGLKDLNLVDTIAPYPSTREELTDYLRKNNDVRIPENDEQIYRIVDDVHNRYSKYLKSNKIDNLANSMGYLGDANLAVGNVLGTSILKLGNAGLKLANHAYEGIKGVFGKGYFAEHPRDYIGLPMLALTDAIAMIPYCTAASPGISRMIRKRMTKEALKEFQKETGTYKPLHKRMRDLYETKIKNKANRLFPPSYSSA
ncbi:MAG: hypothetical protein ACOCQG_03770 [Candidatus Nanoarchaeia archaeon]